MISCRLHVDVVTLAEDDVVSRVDTVVCVARHAQRSATVEEQLALAVECAFLRAARAVGQRVSGAVSQDDEGTLATQQAQRCRVGVGDVRTVELHGIFLVTQDGQ